MSEQIARAPGEEIVWSGVPDAAVIFTQSDLLLVPFSVLWAVSMISLAVMGLHGSAGNVLSMVPLVAFALYFLIGRFWVKRAVKRRTSYTLTTRRAIVVAGRRRDEIAVGTGPLQIRRSADGGHMTVVFGTPTTRIGLWSVAARQNLWANTGMGAFGWLSGGPHVAFHDVADVDGLTRALDRMSASAPGTKPS